MAFLTKSVHLASTKNILPQTFLAAGSVSCKNGTHRFQYRGQSRSQHNGKFTARTMK